MILVRHCTGNAAQLCQAAHATDKRIAWHQITSDVRENFVSVVGAEWDSVICPASVAAAGLATCYDRHATDF